MIKVAIVGYGNLGRGVERALKQNADMELVGVFTRRNPETVQTDGAPAFGLSAFCFNARSTPRPKFPYPTIATLIIRCPPQCIYSVQTDGAPAFGLDELNAQKGTIDVCILCGGSATDLNKPGSQPVEIIETV
jgi:diaminopimelate dehydrogenase